MALSEPSQDEGGHSFLKELKHRKVFQVAGTYLVVGWLVIQITVAVFPQFDIPAWASRFVILAVAAGFPIALVLAWAFELTPEGVKTTRRARAEQGPEPASASIQRKRTGLAILAGALMPAFALGIILGAVGIWYLQGRSPINSAPAPQDASATAPAEALTGETYPVVAVLPFVNMSPDAENAFFADGVHEDLLTNLSRLSQIRVISRTSVMGYAQQTHNIRQIAEELRASHIVEGSVRRIGGRVRITAQLIDARSDEHLWANRFDRDLDDIFAIQSQVADEIAHALHTELSPSERAQLLDAPTRSVRAYDLYLKAREINRMRENREELLLEGIALLREAVGIDPDFADAWSRLAWYYASRVHFQHGDPEENLAEAESALARAKALAPERMETLLAEAYVHYHGRKDYDAALQVLAEAIRKEPGQADLLAAEAYVLRRVGRFQDSLERLQEAIRLDPRNSALLQQALFQVRAMNRFEDARDILRRLHAFYPDDVMVEQELFGMEMLRRPDFDRILTWAEEQEAQLESMGSEIHQPIDPYMMVASLFLLDDRIAKAEAMLRFTDRFESPFGDAYQAAIAYALYRNARYRSRPDEAADHIEKLRSYAMALSVDEHPYPMYRMWVRILQMTVALHDQDDERAQGILEKIETEYAEHHGVSLIDHGNLRGNLLRARILAHPDRAYEIYAAEKEEEIPGLSFEGVMGNPIEFAALLDDPRFQAEIAQRPAYHTFLARMDPKRFGHLVGR